MIGQDTQSCIIRQFVYYAPALLSEHPVLTPDYKLPFIVAAMLTVTIEVVLLAPLQLATLHVWLILLSRKLSRITK